MWRMRNGWYWGLTFELTGPLQREDNMSDKEAPKEPDNRPAVGGPVQRMVRPGAEALGISRAQKGDGLRYFIRRGATTWYSVGFRTKHDAGLWIDSHGDALDWRAGYLFRLRGDARDVQIVTRKGEALKA